MKENIYLSYLESERVGKSKSEAKPSVLSEASTVFSLFCSKFLFLSFGYQANMSWLGCVWALPRFLVCL